MYCSLFYFTADDILFTILNLKLTMGKYQVGRYILEKKIGNKREKIKPIPTVRYDPKDNKNLYR